MEVRADVGGFDLGTWTESTRSASRSSGDVFHFEGRNDVGCYQRSGDFRGETTYTAPAVTLERLLESVRLPDGRGALESGATVEARSEAVPVAPDSVPTAWRSVPIHVTIDLAGYEKCSFLFRLDGARETIVLKPLE